MIFAHSMVLSQKNYELLGKWQLGNDLSSDICGMAVDYDTIYCSIYGSFQRDCQKNVALLRTAINF